MPLITKVLKAAELNATNLARFAAEGYASLSALPVPWERFDALSQQRCIDEQQRLLDRLVQEGILGE